MTKKAKVVMLPADKDGWAKGDITLCINAIMSGSANIGTIHIATYDYPAPNPYHQPQHIYLTTDDVIEAGDWYIDDCNLVRQAITSDKDYWAVRKEYKKVISSTDPSLSLPGIPKQWITDVFIPQKGKIDEIELETDSYFVSGNYSNICIKCHKQFKGTDKRWYLCSEDSLQLKLTPENEVIII